MEAMCLQQHNPRRNQDCSVVGATTLTVSDAVRQVPGLCEELVNDILGDVETHLHVQRSDPLTAAFRQLGEDEMYKAGMKVENICGVLCALEIIQTVRPAKVATVLDAVRAVPGMPSQLAQDAVRWLDEHLGVKPDEPADGRFLLLSEDAMVEAGCGVVHLCCILGGQDVVVNGRAAKVFTVSDAVRTVPGMPTLLQELTLQNLARWLKIGPDESADGRLLQLKKLAFRWLEAAGMQREAILGAWIAIKNLENKAAASSAPIATSNSAPPGTGSLSSSDIAGQVRHPAEDWTAQPNGEHKLRGVESGEHFVGANKEGSWLSWLKLKTWYIAAAAPETKKGV